jgi:cobalt-zinc-cadmium resistance protein CzcA
VTDLKTIQDWILERRFKAIPGVIDVTTWGGKSKTYDITVDLDRLLAYGLTLKQVLDALNGANVNVGANTVNIGPQSAVIRSVGQIRSMEDIRNTLLLVRDGAPVLVSDVANVTVGFEPRLGIAGHDGDDDVVEGIVLMRRGAETLPTLGAVKAAVEKINRSDLLPPGVHIERIYDRSVLVDITTRTVLHNMVMGVSLIFLIQWLFLGDLRSALIVSATIPFALLFAVVILVLSGESANLLSMGAIDFGIIVDATVIMVENIFRHLAEASHRRGPQQGRRDLPRLQRGHAGDLLLGDHHHRGLPAAVHAVRRRRPHLRPDGEDLCLCAGRRFARHLHGDACAQRHHPAGARARVGDPRGAGAAQAL